MPTSLRCLLVSCLWVLAACGPQSPDAALNSFQPAQIDTGDRVRIFTSASAAGVAFFANIGQTAVDPHGTCPSVVINANVTTYTGGCTTTAGVMYLGTLTVTHDPMNDSYESRFTDYGTQQLRSCTPGGASAMSLMETQTFTGLVRSGNLHAFHGSFHVELRGEGDVPDTHCVLTHGVRALVYDGTWSQNGADANNDGIPDHAIWNGSGRMGDSVNGVVHAQTSDETIERPVCNSEALSGTTQLQAGAHAAIITYDGSSDCTPDSTVTWTYDAAPQGSLSGVACSVSHGARGSRAVLVLGLAGALAAALRRRRRTR